MADHTAPQSKEDLGKLRDSRITEEYILQQWDSVSSSDRFQNHKDRINTFKQLYRGEWSDLYSDGYAMPGDPLIENIAKNGIHDISALASENRPAVIFIREGQEDKDAKKGQLREAIERTIWEKSKGNRIAHRVYMDLLGTGIVAIAVTKSKKSEYAKYTRLDPARCWPDVRDGEIQDLLYAERIKVREAARKYPELDLAGVKAWADDDCELVDYYNDEEVVKAIILTKNGKVDKSKGVGDSIHIIERWKHDLERVPVAFEQVDTLDGAFRGSFDQAGPPILARNRIVQFMIDYIEEMVHSPFERKNILNGTQPPGRGVVYEHDPNAEDSFMRRVAPAVPAGAVFGLTQYLEQQSSGETTQPPSRQGQVSQSIASASFVESTQGRLTTLTKELQDLYASLRQQCVEISFKIEEKWLDREKPLWYPVGNKHTYKPSRDIKGWYHCRVEHGATSGYDRATGDARIMQHLGARLIGLETARLQLDYVDDPTSEQDRIDREDTLMAIKQRFLADPRMPLTALAKATILFDQGKTLVEVIQEVMPEFEQADLAAQRAAAGPGEPPGAEEVAVEEGVPAEEQALALEKGGVPEEAGPIPEVMFQPPPLQQQIVRQPGG